MITICKSKALGYGHQNGTSICKYLYGCYRNIILSASPQKCSAHYRYIDDKFLIWLHGNDSVTHILEHANNNHTNIKFTHECSKTTAIIRRLRSNKTGQKNLLPSTRNQQIATATYTTPAVARYT